MDQLIQVVVFSHVLIGEESGWPIDSKIESVTHWREIHVDEQLDVVRGMRKTFFVKEELLNEPISVQEWEVSDPSLNFPGSPRFVYGMDRVY